MNEAEEAASVNYVLTLDELSALTREGGKSAETLMNVVALIARRSTRTSAPLTCWNRISANPVLAATLGLRHECIGTLRMALHEGLAGLVAEQVRPVAVEEVRNHPRFKFFDEAGEEGYHSFLGVPLFDCGVLQGVLVVQTMDLACFSDDEVGCSFRGCGAACPVVSEARATDRFIAPPIRCGQLAHNLWWSWDVDATNMFGELDTGSLAGVGKVIPSRCWVRTPRKTIEHRATERYLHSRINYAFRRCREYLTTDNTWSARPTRECSAPVRLPTFRPSSGCTSRCRFIRVVWGC